MKKAEFLKQENVPQFLKDLVEKAPDDAEVEVVRMGIPVPEEEGEEEEGCSCDSCQDQNEDGINIAPYVEILFTHLKEVADLADCKGRIKPEDVDIIRSILNNVESTGDEMRDYLAYQKRKKEGNA